MALLGRRLDQPIAYARRLTTALQSGPSDAAHRAPSSAVGAIARRGSTRAGDLALRRRHEPLATGFRSAEPLNPRPMSSGN